jgi:lysophospholipase L1-like esterase
LKRTIFAILSIVFGVGILEVLSAMFMQFVLTPTKVSEFTYVSTIFPFSPTLLWVMPSNDEYVSDGVSYSTNESGFREYPNLSEHNGSILFLGDSSTFGFGVSAEQSYAARLGSCLQKKVINLATPGYSSTQSRIQLGELIHEHRAAERGSLTADIKYVVIANLWSDMMAAPQTDTQRLLLIEEVLEQRELFDSILYRWSYTFRLLSALLQEEGSVEVLTIDDILNAKETGKTQRVPSKEYRENLIGIVEQTFQIGAQPVLVLLPTNFSGRYPSPRVQSPYRNAAKSVGQMFGVPVLDFDTNPFPKDSFIDIVHPNDQGHQRIATSLCETLVSQ